MEPTRRKALVFIRNAKGCAGDIVKFKETLARRRRHRLRQEVTTVDYWNRACHPENNKRGRRVRIDIAICSSGLLTHKRPFSVCSIRDNNVRFVFSYVFSLNLYVVPSWSSRCYFDPHNIPSTVNGNTSNACSKFGLNIHQFLSNPNRGAN